MFTPGLDPLHDHQIRYRELRREAQNHHLVQEALRAKPRRINWISRMFAMIGKWLVRLGTSLEKGYSASSQVEPKLLYNPSSNKSAR